LFREAKRKSKHRAKAASAKAKGREIPAPSFYVIRCGSNGDHAAPDARRAGATLPIVTVVPVTVVPVTVVPAVMTVMPTITVVPIAMVPVVVAPAVMTVMPTITMVPIVVVIIGAMPAPMIIDAVPTYLLRLDLIDRVLRDDGAFDAHASGDRRFGGRRQRRRLCGRREHHASRNKPHRQF
jgi:hypothetical protein